MELKVKRNDITQVGPMQMKCMKLLPLVGNEPTQAIVLGDNSELQAFSLKRNVPEFLFKTLPGMKISRVELSGQPGHPADRIFVASACRVDAFSRKGKQFLQFQTSLSEKIRSLFVSGTHLFVAGNTVFNHYNDLKDSGYYLSPESIVDLVCVWLSEYQICAILACADKHLRMLDGNNVVAMCELPSMPTVMHLMSAAAAGPGSSLIMFGMQDGNVGLVRADQSGLTVLWTTERRGVSGVAALDTYPIFSQGVPDLVVGRDSGALEIYSFVDGLNRRPNLDHTIGLNSEAISAIQCGKIRKDKVEIVCTTFSGYLFSISGLLKENEFAESQLSMDASLIVVPQLPSAKNANEEIDTEDNTERIKALRAEIEQLTNAVAKEREHFQNAIAKSSSNGAANGSMTVSTLQPSEIHDKFVLDATDAFYSLMIELHYSLDFVVLQSDVKLDVIEDERNTAVLSKTPIYPSGQFPNIEEHNNHFLYTLRFQANSLRLDLQLRTYEGNFGTFQVFLVPRMQPKWVLLRPYVIRPLSLHQRVHSVNTSRPCSTLKLTGSFSFAEMHMLLSWGLPEVPEKIPSGEKAQLLFQSVLLDTQLDCTYQKGEAIFRSENISTLATVRDALTKEATRRKTRIDLSFDLNEQGVDLVLSLIDKKLLKYRKMKTDLKVFDAVKELQASSGLKFDQLPAHYQKVLKEADPAVMETGKRKGHILIMCDRLHKACVDLYADLQKFKGSNAQLKLQELENILEHSYDLKSVSAFFHRSS